MSQAVIVSAVRTPVGRAPMGALSTTRPDDLAAFAICGALDRLPELPREEIDDVILGCAQPEGEQGWNIGRFAALRAGLPVSVPGATINRLCSSGLEAIALADLRIRSGDNRVVVAGGAESMSLIPLGGLKPSPNPWLRSRPEFPSWKNSSKIFSRWLSGIPGPVSHTWMRARPPRRQPTSTRPVWV